jgi:hypothetical protein
LTLLASNRAGELAAADSEVAQLEDLVGAGVMVEVAVTVARE